MILPQGMELYAGWCVNHAKDYCKKRGLDKEMVRLVDRAGQIIVIARKEIEL